MASAPASTTRAITSKWRGVITACNPSPQRIAAASTITMPNPEKSAPTTK